MKKLLLGLAVCFATGLSAQNYPSNGWGNHNNNDYGYNDSNEVYYFPDDYYYEYPDDYYADDYYRGFYNDYRLSLQMVNWNAFFRQYRLNRHQISLILDLNNQFNSYNVWNSYYRSNPQRWYYDRYYALERILGPSIYVVFQNNYYNGYTPITYYHNRCVNYYRPNYYVRPAYVNININHYHINRKQYHQSVGNNYGWKQTRNVSNSFVEDGNRSGSYRNNSSAENDFRTTGTRSNSVENNTRSSSTRSNNAISSSTQPTRTRSASAETTNDVQTPRTRAVRTTQPSRSVESTRNTGSSYGNSVRAERSSSTRSSGSAERSSATRASSSSQRSSAASNQRSSSSGTRGGR